MTFLYRRLEQILHSDQLATGGRLLDFGCASKPYKDVFSERYPTYIGADLAGNKSAEVVVNEDGSLPLPNDSFDCVLSSQVLEHVREPGVYLRESFRVLRPGGSLILSTHGIWTYHPDPTDYWRWTIDGLRLQIETVGFEVIETRGIFGPESSALQLLQDATFYRLPSFVQPIYTWTFQRLIGLIENRHPDKLSPDASIYIVVARKPEPPNPGSRPMFQTRG